MTTAPRPLARARRAIAAGLALWMVALVVLVAAHQADAEHATRIDGSVVHVALGSVADDHVACQEHSATSTFDQRTPPLAGAEPCWLADVAQPGVTSHPRFDHVETASSPEPIAVVIALPPASTPVLSIAPKTSPPV